MDNPFADYSIVYMPYCDGSVFGGDNDVVDPSFPPGPVRYHRGLRNASAGMDLAKATFPHASRITVAGSNGAGGSNSATNSIGSVLGTTPVSTGSLAPGGRLQICARTV